MRRIIEKTAALAMDGGMCALMNGLQWYLRRDVCSQEHLASYLSACSRISREDFYRMPPITEPRWSATEISWESPFPGDFPENNRPRVLIFPTAAGLTAPTVILLHALMSASDIGYRRLAAWFNSRGWNAVFPHLPFHYSRTPRRHLNGSLAITANLVRNAETLRQAVIEQRQLLTLLRARGCREFGLLGTSYGGWTGSLLSFLEPDLQFLSVIQPIVNVEAAIWENPAAASMRRILRKRGIHTGESERHAHLTSPLHGVPLCKGSNILITGGLYDTVSPVRDLRELNRRWLDSRLLEVRQGHFGYQAMRETMRELEGMVPSRI